MSLRLFVIRHGETDWSHSGRYTGRSDILLTRKGEAEAQRIGQRIQGIEFSHVLASPLKRARQTCEFAEQAAQVRVEADLIEWDNGDYEGRTLEEIRSTRPKWNLFFDGCPNGEFPLQVSNRVDRLIATLNKLDGNVALFTHGHLARALAARWIGASIQFGHNFLLDTASLSILTNHQESQPVITLWNSSCLEVSDSKSRQQLSASLQPSSLQPSSLQPSSLQPSAPASKPVEIERWENEGGEIPAEVLKRQFDRSR